jgi:DnaJ-class molecular chaperone
MQTDKQTFCHHCNGSGEGMYEFTKCYVCNGTGIDPFSEDEDEGDTEEDFSSFEKCVTAQENIVFNGSTL